MSDFQDFIKEAGNVVPSKRQLEWFRTGFYAFIHFSPNTYTDLEWGLGNESPDIFDPKKLDCDQWVESVKAAGMKGVVITAKHHDGFCLWDTKYTDHNVMNSPCKRDIVKEVAKACERAGMKFGFYLSPWDRHSPLYGTDAYNNYYTSQLTELLTGYGEVFHIWFDGACGDMGKQDYNFRKYWELVRKYQPNATIFNDRGPDVRWCGNEEGTHRHAEWAVVPSELCGFAEMQTSPSPIIGSLAHMQNSDPDIGSLSNIMYSKGLVFAGAEIDMSIRKGWFWHEKEEPHSLDRLFNTYLNSVGGNACLNLNVPPNRDGLIDNRDVARLRELGAKINTELGKDHAEGATVERVTEMSDTQCVFEVTMKEAAKIRYIELAEDLTKGQRIETFKIELYNEDMSALQDYSVFNGTSVGFRKICCIARDLWDGIVSQKLKITITSARDRVMLDHVKVY